MILPPIERALKMDLETVMLVYE